MKRRVRNIYIAFAVSFIITIIISILYLEQFSALQKSNEHLERSYRVKNKILKVQSFLVEAENLQRGYIITENKQFWTDMYTTEKNIYKEIDSLKLLTLDAPRQQQLLEKLKETVSLRYQLLYQSTNDENSSNLVVFLQNTAKGEMLMKDFKGLANKMDEVELTLLADSKNKSTSLQFVTSFYLKLLLIISILFQLVSFVIISDAYKRRKIYQKTLENKIKELNLSNSEMEQIAFVASHDLQEPLRKIRTFSDKLIKHSSPKLNNDGQKLIDKIATSSRHMQELLNDFINYTRIVKSTEEARMVELEKVIDDVRLEYREVIERKGATLKVGGLPAITGYNYQLHLLFSNLLDNALKFAKAAIPPVIRISASYETETNNGDEKKYIKVSFSDNGIGFEKEFAEKIFIIFQRLHSQNSSYLGKGIGLAICKRVMVNHDGYIIASGEAGTGATFNLYFPEKPEIL